MGINSKQCEIGLPVQRSGMALRMYANQYASSHFQPGEGLALVGALSVIVKTARTFVSGSQHNPTTGDMIYCLLAAVLLIAVSRLCPDSGPN